MPRTSFWLSKLRGTGTIRHNTGWLNRRRSLLKLLLISFALLTFPGRLHSQQAEAFLSGDPGEPGNPTTTNSDAMEVGSNPGGSVTPSTPQPAAQSEELAVIPNQLWNWHAQSTLVVQGYPGLKAKYSGANSLPTSGQARETVSTDLYGGVRLWSGAEAHWDLLMWQGFGLNNTLGIEDFPNGEAYKAGTSSPRLNIARLFIRQTIGIDSGTSFLVHDDPLTLAGKTDAARLTFTLGRFSVKDMFDNNSYANDPRTQFMNWALMANAAWDYPSDALGYTTGAAIELNQAQWTFRYGFFQIDRLRNAWTAEDQFFTWPSYKGAGDGPFFRSWGMVQEYERRHNFANHPGAVRALAYLNHGRIGCYQSALSIPGTDISQTRAYRYRYGFGLNAEQEMTRDIGMFSRIGWNEGKHEAWMFTDINFSASLGVRVKGASWHRGADTFGLATVFSSISASNQKFLAAGETGILDGDGALNYSGEKVLETYYDAKISTHLHAALDYQFVANPAFNCARGPVSIFGTRFHWEF